VSSDKKPEERADWRRVKQLYKQSSEILDDPEGTNVLPVGLAGALAEALGRVFASYDGTEEIFLADLLEVISSLDGAAGSIEERFRHFYNDDRFNRFPDYTSSAANGRRRPKPFEAAVETARRLRDLNRMRSALEDVPTSCILGGSASYGRFYNTIGAKDDNPSDLDLLLVVPDYDHLRKIAEALAPINGITKLANLDERIASLPGVTAEAGGDGRCIFSQKLDVWKESPDPLLAKVQLPSYYTLSIHVFSSADFDYLILRDIPGIMGELERSIWDYRDTPANRLDNQRCFAGIDLTLERDKREVTGGYLAESRVCHVDGDRYYPGLHQNLVLPQFDLRWEMRQHRLTLPLLAFRWKLVERLREERAMRHFEIQTISLSHTRSAVFAPHIVRRVDGHE
jgi:hypothetical protein